MATRPSPPSHRRLLRAADSGAASRACHTWKDSLHPQKLFTFGLLNTKPEVRVSGSSTKSISVPRTDISALLSTSTVSPEQRTHTQALQGKRHEQRRGRNRCPPGGAAPKRTVLLDLGVQRVLLLGELERVRQAVTPALRHADAQPNGVRPRLEQLLEPADRRRRLQHPPEESTAQCRLSGENGGGAVWASATSYHRHDRLAGRAGRHRAHGGA